MKMTIAVANLRMYVWNLGFIWMTIMLGLSESSPYDVAPPFNAYQTIQFNDSTYRVPCKEGWYLYGEKCYGVMGQGSELSWRQASDKCVLEHGNLATIYSKDLQEFLTAFVLLNVKANIWIGLHDRNMEGFHEWSDGSPLHYRNWDIGEPTGRRSYKEDCAEMRFKNGKSEIGTWNDVDCDTKIPYLCQADKDINTSNPDPRFCSLDENGGWKYLNSCYHIVHEEMTWEEAEYFCQEVYGGHLLKIMDSQTQIYISYILSNQSINDFWIGIQIKKQKLQRWSSGWQAIYTNWDEEHQDFLDGTCAVVMPKKTWSSTPCFKQNPFVCETSKDPPPPMLREAPAGWICPTETDEWMDLGGDTCYIVEPYKSLSWFEANFYCHKKGGNLASIHSIAETHLLHPHVINTKERVLTGLHRNLHNNKIFEWADGSELDYENWADGEPNGDDEKCGELWTETMKWNDVPCNIAKGFICSARKVPPKSDQENQTQCQTIVSAQRDSSKPEVSRSKSSKVFKEIKRGVSLKAAIGIPVLILVLCVFIGIAIRYYMKSHVPGFRSKRNTASTEELQAISVQYEKK